MEGWKCCWNVGVVVGGLELSLECWSCCWRVGVVVGGLELLLQCWSCCWRVRVVVGGLEVLLEGWSCCWSVGVVVGVLEVLLECWSVSHAECFNALGLSSPQVEYLRELHKLSRCLLSSHKFDADASKGIHHPLIRSGCIRFLSNLHNNEIR